MDTRQLDNWGREVAAQIARGDIPEAIADKYDLDPMEMDEVLASKPFKDNLATYGEAVVEAWAETQAAKKTISFRRRIAENLDIYAQELDKLAMSGQLKPEKRADILLALLKAGSGPEDIQVSRVEMPPQLLENWARRTREFEKHSGEFVYGTRTAQSGNQDKVGAASGDGDTEE